jgi:hypothetical protein
MNASEILYNAVVAILTALPRRYPKAAVLALAGCLVYLLASFIFPVVYAVLPALFEGRYQLASTISITYRAVGVLAYLMDAVALVLLLAAVFSGRSPQPKSPERNQAG